MAGYSATPLLKKLGIKENARLRFENAPGSVIAELGPLPGGATVVNNNEQELDLVLLFTTSRDELEARFGRLAGQLKPNGMLWISWPKKASKMATDLNENRVRETGLAAGLVDVKVCAIDETWSGLKFVRRVKDR
jgi:hypothetical protein